MNPDKHVTIPVAIGQNEGAAGRDHLAMGEMTVLDAHEHLVPMRIDGHCHLDVNGLGADDGGEREPGDTA